MLSETDLSENGRCEEAAERKPHAARSDEDAEADIARVQRLLREHHLGDVHRGAPDHGEVPDDQHGPERRRGEDEANPVADVSPVAARERLLGAKLALGNRRDEARRDEERDCVHRIGDGRPPLRQHHPGGDRPDHPRDRLDRLQERVGIRELVVRHEVGKAGVDRGPEETGRDTGDARERDDRAGAAHERQRGEDAEAHEIGRDHEPPPREAVDERAEDEPEHDDRQEVCDEQGGDPDSRPRLVVDVDRQRDGCEVRPEAGAGGSEEQEAELG